MKKIMKKLLLLVIALFALYGCQKKNDTINTVKDFVEYGVLEVFTESPSETSTSNSSSLEMASLVRVVDGDTVIVNLNGTEERVRLLAVNTQESVHSDDTKNNDFGKKASEFTKSQLQEGQTVYLQYDKSKEDQYGRLLAYLWLNNNIDITSETDIEKYMYNAILLKEGMANVTIYKPNDMYQDVFYEIQNDAIDKKTGFWSDPEFVKLVTE